MIDVKSFRENVVDPVLQHIKLYSPAASNLMVGTAVQESGLKYLKQINGPALGVYQIEPATLADVISRYLLREDKKELAYLVWGLAGNAHHAEQLIWNMGYATAIARVKYFMATEKLPEAEDIDGLAHYWKTWYNTPLGAGTTQQFKDNYLKYVQPAIKTQ